MGSKQRTHAVCLPFPSQGHINPMMKLAKLLSHKGFHITFVNTEINHRRLINSRGKSLLEASPSIRFETIPDGLPPSDLDVTQDGPSLVVSIDANCLSPFRELVRKLNDSSSGVPPVTCIFADGVMSFSKQVAGELGIPFVVFWTSSGCGFLAYTYFATLVEKGYTPFKDSSYLTNGCLDTVIDCIPTMEGMRLRDIPTWIRTTNPDDFMLNYSLTKTERSRGASAVLFNTFEALEQDAIDALSLFLPPIYAIGPLHLLEAKMEDKGLDQLRSTLWKDDSDCIKWMDSQEPNSVIYVNFGSTSVLTDHQLLEFAWGLANSKRTFLWIIRLDIMSGKRAVLPSDFLDETKDRRFIASWCDQEKVLEHPSVGGFLTHCGWNSVLESLSGGVPMLCWPFFAEQPTNCWFSCNKWGVGMEIDSNVKRDEVSSLIIELMTGEKGQQMKKRAMEWKKKILESTDGSSYENLEKVISHVCLA